MHFRQGFYRQNSSTQNLFGQHEVNRQKNVLVSQDILQHKLKTSGTIRTKKIFS